MYLPGVDLVKTAAAVEWCRSKNRPTRKQLIAYNPELCDSDLLQKRIVKEEMPTSNQH